MGASTLIMKYMCQWEPVTQAPDDQIFIQKVHGQKKNKSEIQGVVTIVVLAVDKVKLTPETALQLNYMLVCHQFWLPQVSIGVSETMKYNWLQSPQAQKAWGRWGL